MHVKGIIWVGVSTGDRQPMVDLFSGVLGLEVTTDVHGFTRLTAPNGDRLELFGPDSTEYDHLDTGPVAGLWVEDATAARDELVSAGVESCTPIQRGRDGHAWFYFKGPDGNFYELCEQISPSRHD